MKVIRFLILLAIMLILSLLLHLLSYGTDISYEDTSNVLFVVGFITFLLSVVTLTGSYEIFYAIKYTTLLVVKKNTRTRYPTFYEYKSDKETIMDGSIIFEILAGSMILVAVAIFLGSKV